MYLDDLTSWGDDDLEDIALRIDAEQARRWQIEKQRRELAEIARQEADEDTDIEPLDADDPAWGIGPVPEPVPDYTA
ncbi:hypothetical protein OS128_05115 [Corynebacterium sp. P5848]|uniref:hypothetical protein n=1 Tax=Corynebacterium marambiense TaxID=2765364 RepID=UPI0022608D48|nr:hypothetical protein [Corynebacterium marambiense]MCX7542290.1 hypothetical protein [Corynebacterium marambiense]